MQHVINELKSLVRREAEIDLQAQSPDGRPPLPHQVERRFCELMAEEYQLAGLAVPENFISRKVSARRK